MGSVLLKWGKGLINFSELLWAVYSAVQVLETSHRSDYQALAKGWQAWLDYAKSTAAKVCIRPLL